MTIHPTALDPQGLRFLFNSFSPFLTKFPGSSGLFGINPHRQPRPFQTMILYHGFLRLHKGFMGNLEFL